MIEVVDREVVELLLELYSAATGHAVGLYEGSRVIIPTLCLERFRPYCKKLRSYPEGRKWCDADHQRRGANARQEGFEVCHAGLFNYTLPIEIEGEWMGTLLCGQVRFEKGTEALRGLDRHRYVLEALNLPLQEKKELERLYWETGTVDLGDLEGKESIPFLHHLYAVQRQFYKLIHANLAIQREQEAFERNLESIAHEFQIRLQGLYADSENLLEAMGLRQPITQRMMDDANEILNGVQRLNVLVQNLSLGLGEYDWQLCDLREIIEESVALYRNEAKRKNIFFEIDVAEPCRLEISPLHIRHVMNNLVCNAVKYSYSGTSVRPRFIRIIGRGAKRGYKVSVENYGVGILPDELEKIFEAGYRGILTRDERRTGAGLGLWIAKVIVEAHGGSIEVMSYRVGSAWLTRFTVMLPFSRESEPFV